jgi:hypothetical protein
MAFLKDIKIVDLNRSRWDKKQSDRKKGNYVFEPNGKVYVNKMKDYLHGETRHPWVFTWCTHDPGRRFGTLHKWRVDYQATFVDINDPYWPEGMIPDAEGKYIFRDDMVLVKIPLEVHLEKNKRERDIANRTRASKMREFEADAKAAGADIPKEMLERLHSPDMENIEDYL